MAAGSIGNALFYAAGPAGATVLGAAAATLWRPTAKVNALVQHFAAGAVIAGLSIEIVPEMLRRGGPLVTALGMAVGVAGLLLMRRLSGEHEGREEPSEADQETGKSGLSWGMVIAIFVDVLIDGMLLGIASALGESAGLLLAIALGLELLSLGLVNAAEARGRGARWTIGLGASVGIIFAAGTLIGAAFLAHLPKGWMEGVLAASAAALLYLVTEELLTEAHEVPETPLATTLFFAGFTIPLLVQMVVSPAPHHP